MRLPWRDDERKRQATQLAWESREIAALEAELEGMPELNEVYRRHVRREP